MLVESNKIENIFSRKVLLTQLILNVKSDIYILKTKSNNSANSF